MGSLLDVVSEVLPKNHLQVALAEDEQPAEAEVLTAKLTAILTDLGNRPRTSADANS